MLENHPPISDLPTGEGIPTLPHLPLLEVLLERWQDGRDEGRDIAMEELCQECPHLRPEVEKRIGALVAMERLLQGADTPVPVETRQEDESPETVYPKTDRPKPVSVGPAVPGFTIMGELGRGGMGVVYKARQEHLKRTVALKMILSGGYSDEDDRARFLGEAEAIAAIDHPGIVKVYTYGTHAGLPWFALEYCPGGSLAKKLNGTPLPSREGAAVVAQLARAMQAAHDKGIIHRDLKPGNVLLAVGQPFQADSSVGQPFQADSSPGAVRLESLTSIPKVTDFGLARRLEVPGRTQTGAVMGTPPYMPPEQARGSKDIGPPADVYALGAILYECLAGRPPFRAATPYQTVMQVLTDEPVAPRTLVPGIPGDLETICLKCLQKEIGKRYASAADLADDLGRFLTGEPIRARPVPAWERAVKWARRRPAMAALMAAIILAGLFASAGGLFFGLYESQRQQILSKWQDTQQDIARRLREAQRDAADGRLALERKQEGPAADSLTKAAETLGSALSLVSDPDPEDLRGQIKTLQDQVQNDREELKRRQEMEPRIARLRDDWRKVLFHEVSLSPHNRTANLAQVCAVAPQALAPFGIKLDRPPQESVAALQREQQRFASPADLREVVEKCYEVLLAWADAEAQTGTLPDKPPVQRIRSAQRALQLLDITRALAQAHRLPDSPAYHARRAGYLAQAGRNNDGREEQRRAKALPPSTAGDHFLAGLEYYRQGKTDLAAEACGLALVKQHKHLWAQYLLAVCQVKAQRWTEAKASCNACLLLHDEFLYARLLRGAVDTELAALLQKRNPLEAAKLFKAAQQDFAQSLAQASDPQTADPLGRYAVLTSRSVLWARQNHWNEAIADLQEAIRLDPAATQAHVNLAEVCRLRGDLKGAIAALNRGIGRRPEDATLYHTRARIFLTLKDEGSAQRDLKEAIARMPQGEPERLASAHVELGRLKLKRGDARAALTCFDAALKVQPNHPPAQLQRARALLQMNQDGEAGKALDRYLASGKAAAKDYLARGLIHSKLREYAQAVKAYNRVLVLDDEDSEALTQRGWAYLQLDAPRPALADFEAALKLRRKHAASLCGRGHAEVLLGRITEALRDGEEALRSQEGNDEQLRVACIYTRAAALRRRMPPQGRTTPEAGYEERAAELLCKALQRVPPGQRGQFWREHIQPEQTLAALRWHPKVLRIRDSK